MALKALMLKKKIDQKRSELAKVNDLLASFEEREAELEQAINEAADLPDEEREEGQAAVEAAVADFEAEKAEASANAEKLEGEISELETELSEQDTEDSSEDTEDKPEERKVEKKMEIREVNNELVTRDDVQNFLSEVRTCIKEKRAITNVGLTIPEVFLGVLRANLERYSKLYRHVTVRRISGTGRQAIMGQYDEAIWTECCANLNELALTFYSDDFDCFKLGGFYAICNASLEDSDLNLAQEISVALGQAIGLALDKAILYGKNTSANAKMPLGIVSRLAQTAQPSDYPADARPWVDLHESNIKSIASGVSGAALIAAMALDFGAAKGKYSRGEKVWVMNETTYTKLGAATVTTASDGSIVTGVFDRMPVVGGIIEVIDFIPDDVIIAGYFDCYTLVERAGEQFASSEHVRFLQDQTVFKATARYDGKPVIGEAFVAIGINGVTPDATMTFAADTANQGA